MMSKSGTRHFQSQKSRIGCHPINQTDSLWNDLSAYYRMDWGNGITAYDYSGKENNGSLNNGPGG